MLAVERTLRIRELLTDSAVVSVSDLALALDVSPLTVRRDLERLERSGEIVRTRGGAIGKGHGTGWEPPWDAKYGAHADEKMRIGRAAAALVKPGDTVLLDSGSTVARVVQFLSVSCTVVTTDLKSAVALAGRRGPVLEIVMVGGSVRPGLYGVTGPFATEMLSEVHGDWAFLGADAVDPVAGITNASIPEVPIKRRLIEAARTVVLVADSSKVSRVSLAAVAPITRIHQFIVDEGIDQAALTAFRDAGVSVVVV
jgi:DeoR/GlpR family transcriptional regulator of sugar metabolism